VGRVYVIVVVPGATPVITPVAIPTVATAEADVLQTPPAAAHINVPEAPVQTVVVPVIGDGIGNTVATIPAMHPDGSV